jgi:hypothetical protein
VTQQLRLSKRLLGKHDVGGFPVLGPVGESGAGGLGAEEALKMVPVMIRKMKTKARARKRRRKMSRKISNGVILAYSVIFKRRHLGLLSQRRQLYELTQHERTQHKLSQELCGVSTAYNIFTFERKKTGDLL